MADESDGEDRPGRGRFPRNRGLRVVREGSDAEVREGLDGLGRDDRRDGTGRAAAGRDRRAEERDAAPGGAGGPGRDAGASDPLQPDTVGEQQRRDRRLQIEVDSDPAADLDERDVAFDRAAALRREASNERGLADDLRTDSREHDRWYYDADAAVGQATDPADRSLAIRDKNEHRAGAGIDDSLADRADDRADAAEASARRAENAAPAAPRPGEERRVADTENAQQHSGVRVKDGVRPPLSEARGAVKDPPNAPSARRGPGRKTLSPSKNRDGRDKH